MPMNKLDDSIEIKKLDLHNQNKENETQAEQPKNLDETFDEDSNSTEAPKIEPQKLEITDTVDIEKGKTEFEMKDKKSPTENLNMTMDILSEENCMICLENIYENPALGDLGKKSEDFFENSMFKTLSKKYNETHRMKTPCNHFFHTSKIRLRLIRRMLAEVDGSQNGVPLLQERSAGYLLVK